MEQVAIMQNIFYNRKITKVFDLKGSLRGRFARNVHSAKEESAAEASAEAKGSKKRNTDADDGDHQQGRGQPEADAGIVGFGWVIVAHRAKEGVADETLYGGNDAPSSPKAAIVWMATHNSIHLKCKRFMVRQCTRLLF